MHYCPHTSKWCKNDTACVAVGECLQASGVKFANEKPPPPAAPTLEQLDAARYRWLRDSDHDVLGIMAWYDAHSDPVVLTGPYADKAVDEAMLAMLNAIQPCKSDPET